MGRKDSAALLKNVAGANRIAAKKLFRGHPSPAFLLKLEDLQTTCGTLHKELIRQVGHRSRRARAVVDV